MSLNKEWLLKELEQSEESDPHRPIEEEYSFYQAVKTGDLDFVMENCRNNVFGSAEGMGVLSQNSLTNIKYHFVITTALITRQCVEGGMALEQAYRLSDFYILKMDSCTNIESVVALHEDMVIDFTKKMSILQKDNIISRSIVLCTEYIYNHIHDRITIQELAEHTSLSASYLSRLFKKEIGVSVSDYIRDKKIEKAQNLLKYSDFSLIEIANYLAFSSQSHFIQVFEKQVGITPKKYRDKFYRSTW